MKASYSKDPRPENMLLPLLLTLYTGVFQATTCFPHGPAEEVPFRVTRVEKEVVGEIFRTRVMFEGSPTPTILLGDDENLRRREPSGPGVLEFETPLHPRAFESVTFVLPDRQCKISLSLSEDDRSINIPAVLHSVQPDYDIQLQPDQLLNVTFAASVEGMGNGSLHLESSRVEVLIPSNKEDNTIYSYETFNHATEDFPYHKDDHLPVDLDQQVEVVGNQHRTRTVLTRKAGWHFRAGVFRLTSSLRFSCNYNCLVYHVLDMRTVRFYPQGEVGPFPQGFLGFIHHPPDSDSSSSSQHTSCPVNSAFDDCNIVCEAMGDELMTSVEITKMMTSSASSSSSSSSLAGGEGNQLDEVNVVSGGWGMSVVHVSDVSFQDAGEFQCSARSLAGSASETLTLGVLQSAEIDEEASTFTITDQAKGLIEFTCVANGKPAPNISFVDFTVRPYNHYTPPMTHPTQSQTRAQMVIEIANPQSDMVGVYCIARNDDGYDSSSKFADLYYYR